MQWRNKPLFRREGDVKFKTGNEAAKMLSAEATRRDPGQELFLQTFTSCMSHVSPVFDRNPKYAWVAKQLTEPERMLQFRISWLDDADTTRVNRGFRVQYTSALGPYDGGLHFGRHVNADFVKAAAFDEIFTNSLAGMHQGAAAGGSDFDPDNKSEAEIQRFCQSFMLELSKYIGADVDLPSMGVGVGPREIGFLYGQYKRTHMHASHKGRGLLWAGHVPWVMAEGYAVAHFAERILQEKGDSLAGKRVLITGSGPVALSAAERVLQFGGVPLSLSDSTGVVYEEGGIDEAKLEVLKKIKSERGAHIGRYVVASTTAKFLELGSIFSQPCDVCMPCGDLPNEIGKPEAALLADSGCRVVVEGGKMASTPTAAALLLKRGVLHGSYKTALCASSVARGWALMHKPIDTLEQLDATIEDRTSHVFEKAKETAKEYSKRGDLLAGTHISAFTRVADVMMQHGAV